MQVLAVCPTCPTAGKVTLQEHSLASEDNGGAFAALDTLFCTNPNCIVANNGAPPTAYISFNTNLTPEQVRANHGGTTPDPEPDPQPDFSELPWWLRRLLDRRNR